MNNNNLKSTSRFDVAKLIENGPIVVFSWSGEDGWPVEYVSSNVVKLLGHSAEHFLKQDVKFVDFIYEEDIERISKEVQDFIANKTESFYQEYRIYSASGDIVWVEDFTIIEYDTHAKPLHIHGYLIDVTSKKAMEYQNWQLANFDTLTGLPNRQKMSQDIKMAHACIILNIDSFKEINDFFGIYSGDTVLKQVAEWFKEIELAPYRIDGDEFAILFYEKVSKVAIENSAIQIISFFEDQLFKIGQETISLRMSAGISIGEDDLLTKADIALHVAKEKKIQFAFYEDTENIEEKYRTNIAIAGKIRKALLEDRIICHYQPIKDFKNGNIKKYEALVRAVEKNGSLVPPNDFLPIAKKTKLYQKITKEVVRKACALFENRNEEFSINLSISDIEDMNTVNEILKVIVATNTAKRVVFELLETEGVQNYEAVESFITQAKELGAKIAIDDFGTGYSNFEHILNLNVDYIKIDGSLIKGICDNKRHRIIVETIVEFAKKIGAKTIAEFVCDENVYSVVKSLGVDYSQGYYTGKPEPINA